MDIPYTGGQNNLQRFIPEDFRNDTFKDEGMLRLPGSSIKIMSPENEKFISNVKGAIKILEYIEDSFGFATIIKDGTINQIVGIKLYEPGVDDRIIALSDIYVSASNPTLENILSDPNYVDLGKDFPKPSDLTETDLTNSLADLKEHEAEGAVDNYIFNFTKFNLLIIEAMALFFLIYGGIVWVTAAGDESQIEKGKSTILWAVIGVIAGLVVYVFVNIITQIFT